MKHRVLLLDDDQAMCTMLATRLGTRGLEVTARTSAAEALALVGSDDFDALVTDINMKGTNGLEVCRSVLESRPNMPVILITAFGTMETAILAIRAGAYDFLPKPFEIDQLVLAIERGITLSRLKDEVQRLRRAVVDAQSFDELVGASPKMTELYALLEKVAGSDAPVLVTGESGTGKELVARALHRKGPRSKGPFVAVNCAAMPEALLESELFGHVRGAFTDAKAAKEGLFVAARGGTIFLDEIGELPLGLQPKLLRALQERAVRPVGATTEIAFDARIVTATNRDLEAMVEERTFREDLYFRVNVIQLELPPLRARGGDVLLLAQHFLERIAARANKRVVGFSPEAAQKLLAYAWPGNVRELQNSLERAVALASFDKVAVSDLPEKVRAYRSTQLVLVTDDPSELVSLEEMERRYVTRVVESVAGNKSAAARILHIERKTLYRMLERWGK
ncbi:MAG TPA: sigma-54 dependent transcriptional regulator [Labilithrix sp.]|nr:sigma-54 dependent transcriptional regulator [Labilithrix sp.]